MRTILKNPETTAATIDRAVQIAQTPPKGPVRVGLPKNYLQMDVPLAGASTPSAPSSNTVPEQEVSTAAEHLLAAERPLFWPAVVCERRAGRRRSDASRSDSTRLSYDVQGKGVFPEDHDLSAGVLAGSASPELLDCLADSDAVLAVGSTSTHTGHAGGRRTAETLIQVTIDADDLGTGYDPTVGILADAADAMTAIENRIAAADTAPASKTDGAERAQAVRDATARRIEPLVDSEPPLTSAMCCESSRRTPFGCRHRCRRRGVPRLGAEYVCGVRPTQLRQPRVVGDDGHWTTVSREVSNLVTSLVHIQVCIQKRRDAVLSRTMSLRISRTSGGIIAPKPIIRMGLLQKAVGGRSNRTGRRSISGLSLPGWGWKPRRPTRRPKPHGGHEAVQTDAPTLVEVRTDPAEPQASEWMRE